MTGCFFLGCLRESRLALSDDCLGREGEGLGSENLEGLRVASLRCFEVESAEGALEGAAPR